MKNRITTLALAAGLLLGGNAAACAELLQCSGFIQTVGYAGHNPPSTATITFQPGQWSVHYVLLNGQTVERSEQFDMIDKPDGEGRTSWRGNFRKDANKWMHGEVRTRDGRLVYVENLYDSGNHLLSTNEIDCGPIPAPNPPVIAAPPAPQAPTSPWLVDHCVVSFGVEWYLAFDQQRGIAEWVDSAHAYPSGDKRYGPYYDANGVINITVGRDQTKLYLHSDGSLLWSSGSASGSMQCSRFATDKPGWWTDPATEQTPAAPPPVMAQGSAHDSMPITVVGTRAIAPVILGAMAVNMMIDTGCSDLAITKSIADQLLASGQTTYGEDAEYTLADGSKHMNKTLNIATVTIGGHVLHNVHAGIGEEGGMLLLGFTVLQQISPKFSIDSAAGMLTFG